jgi:hypothetical protein
VGIFGISIPKNTSKWQYFVFYCVIPEFSLTLRGNGGNAHQNILMKLITKQVSLIFLALILISSTLLAQQNKVLEGKFLNGETYNGTLYSFEKNGHFFWASFTDVVPPPIECHPVWYAMTGLYTIKDSMLILKHDKIPLPKMKIVLDVQDNFNNGYSNETDSVTFVFKTLDTTGLLLKQTYRKVLPIPSKYELIFKDDMNRVLATKKLKKGEEWRYLFVGDKRRLEKFQLLVKDNNGNTYQGEIDEKIAHNWYEYIFKMKVMCAGYEDADHYNGKGKIEKIPIQIRTDGIKLDNLFYRNHK